MLRVALIEEVREGTRKREFPSLPADFDVRHFVLKKVGPMVRGLFPAKECQVILDLFENSLVFVTQDSIEQLLSEIQHLHSAWQIANLYLGSLDLPGMDGKPVGFSEETTFYVSMAYFDDDDPFADWVVSGATHILPRHTLLGPSACQSIGVGPWLVVVAQRQEPTKRATTITGRPETA